MSKNIRLQAIGRLHDLPDSTQRELHRVIEATSVCGAAAGFGAALATGERWLTDASDAILVVDIRAARAAGFHPVPERLERRAIQRFDGKPAPDDQWTVVQPAGLPPLPKPKLTPRERRLESWRKKLLDLTLRNKLLNDRDKAGVPLFAEGDEAIALLENTLWNETPLVLKARGAMRDMSPAHVADEIGRRILRSTLEEDELFKRATKAYRDACSSLEETGARALFVAVGFLEYSVEQRKEPLRAPLVLVPVELERISRSEGFRVRPVADDTVPNAALVESLRAAHGLDIGLGTGLGSALVEDEHGLDIRAILPRVRQAVRAESLIPLSSWPETTTLPAVCLSTPAMILRSVVLPDPEGPISAAKSPLSIWKLTLSRARTSDSPCL
jgi:hypothetical protein